MTMVDEVKSGRAQLLDVRTLEEWQEGHIEYALHIPLDELLRGEMEGLIPTKKIYVHCRSGGRAGTATAYLKTCDFEAENAGGLGDWITLAGK